MEMNMTENKHTELELEVANTTCLRISSSIGRQSSFWLRAEDLRETQPYGAFHVLIKKSLDLNQIALYLGVSRRKVDLLSRVLKDNFFEQFVAPEDRKLCSGESSLCCGPNPCQRPDSSKCFPRSTTKISMMLWSSFPNSKGPARGRTVLDDDQERRLVRDHWLAKSALIIN